MGAAVAVGMGVTVGVGAGVDVGLAVGERVWAVAGVGVNVVDGVMVGGVGGPVQAAATRDRSAKASADIRPARALPGSVIPRPLFVRCQSRAPTSFRAIYVQRRRGLKQ